IQGQLANQNVVIATGTDPNTPGNGDIFVQSSIRWRTDNSLTLSAYRNIDITTNGVKIVNDANGNLVLRADSTGRGQGTVVFEDGAQVDYLNSAGTVSIFYNPPSGYQHPFDFLCPPCSGDNGVKVRQSSQLMAYMLVNNANDLQSVNTDVTRPDAYALGRDINASSTANFKPLGTLNTIFDGQGYTISNLKNVDSTAPNVGLFSSIGSTGVVRNLNLTDVAVSALNSQFVGALAGTNAGTISNISATGIVQVGSGSTAGGWLDRI